MSHFFSGVWRDSVLHVTLLEAMEEFPPFGTARESHVLSIHAKLNADREKRDKIPLLAVERRIEQIVDTKNVAFDQVDPADFTHPDFLAAAKRALDIDEGIAPAEQPAKRARPMDGAALRDSISPPDNVRRRLCKYERSWNRALRGEQLKELSRMVYGSMVGEHRFTRAGEIVAFFSKANLERYMNPVEAARYACKPPAEMRQVLLKCLRSNAVFFTSDDPQDVPLDDKLHDDTWWTIGPEQLIANAVAPADRIQE